MPADTDPVRVLALGGTTRPGSSAERALLAAIRGARNEGAEVRTLLGRELMLPIYDTETTDRVAPAQALVESIRWAEGLLVSSPGYHGGISGMIKNALDYVEDLREPGPDGGAYLDGMAVGCVAVAGGWQAAVSTLVQLRQVVHALRGWPTPLGAAVNSSATALDDRGESPDSVAVEQLEQVGGQVVEFARMRRARDGR